MQTCELAPLISQPETSNKPHLEFLKVPDPNMGLYVPPAGGADPQSPHTEEEVYYMVSGRAKIQVADTDHAVQAGSIVHVVKNVEHRFHLIEEELTIWCFSRQQSIRRNQKFSSRSSCTARFGEENFMLQSKTSHGNESK